MEHQAHEEARSPPPRIPEPEPQIADHWSPFVASNGRHVRVSCTLEPVFELKGFGRIGFRMARKVMPVGSDVELSPVEVSNLSRADILRVDMATIMRGISRLKAEGDRQHPSLIVPVSFISLSSTTGRGEIIAALRQAAGLVKQGIICEICDVEGVPSGPMLSATSLIKPFSLFMVGRLGLTPPAPGSLNALKDVGLKGLSVECPARHAGQEFHAWARSTIEAARRITKSVLVYRAPSPHDAGVAAMLGATHAGVRT